MGSCSSFCDDYPSPPPIVVTEDTGIQISPSKFNSTSNRYLAYSNH